MGLESNVSSLPPDSILGEPTGATDRTTSPLVEQATKRSSKSRSATEIRIAQKVMQKLGQSDSGKKIEAQKEPGAAAATTTTQDKRRYGFMLGGDSQSEISSASHRSLSDVSHVSSKMAKNPKLLEMVEETIKRMILPEINAIKEDQRSFRRQSRETDETTPTQRSAVRRPKVVLNQEGDDPGVVLSRGDSEHTTRKSSREYSSHLSEGEEVADSEVGRMKKTGRGQRDLAAAGLAGGLLTAAALRDHEHRDRNGDRRRRQKERPRRAWDEIAADPVGRACIGHPAKWRCRIRRRR